MRCECKRSGASSKADFDSVYCQVRSSQGVNCACEKLQRLSDPTLALMAMATSR